MKTPQPPFSRRLGSTSPISSKRSYMGSRGDRAEKGSVNITRVSRGGGTDSSMKHNNSSVIETSKGSSNFAKLQAN